MSARRPTSGSSLSRPTRGRADFARMRAMTERDIQRSSPPELANLPPDFWDNAAMVMPSPKHAISLRVDQDVLTWFKSLGPRYQTRMNAVLRSYMKRIGAKPRKRGRN